MRDLERELDDPSGRLMSGVPLPTTQVRSEIVTPPAGNPADRLSAAGPATGGSLYWSAGSAESDWVSHSSSPSSPGGVPPSMSGSGSRMGGGGPAGTSFKDQLIPPGLPAALEADLRRIVDQFEDLAAFNGERIGDIANTMSEPGKPYSRAKGCVAFGYAKNFMEAFPIPPDPNDRSRRDDPPEVIPGTKSFRLRDVNGFDVTPRPDNKYAVDICPTYGSTDVQCSFIQHWYIEYMRRVAPLYSRTGELNPYHGGFRGGGETGEKIEISLDQALNRFATIAAAVSEKLQDTQVSVTEDPQAGPNFFLRDHPRRATRSRPSPVKLTFPTISGRSGGMPTFDRDCVSDEWGLAGVYANKGRDIGVLWQNLAFMRDCGLNNFKAIGDQERVPFETKNPFSTGLLAKASVPVALVAAAAVAGAGWLAASGLSEAVGVHLRPVVAPAIVGLAALVASSHVRNWVGHTWALKTMAQRCDKWLYLIATRSNEAADRLYMSWRYLGGLFESARGLEGKDLNFWADVKIPPLSWWHTPLPENNVNKLMVTVLDIFGDTMLDNSRHRHHMKLWNTRDLLEGLRDRVNDHIRQHGTTPLLAQWSNKLDTATSEFVLQNLVKPFGGTGYEKYTNGRIAEQLGSIERKVGPSAEKFFGRKYYLWNLGGHVYQFAASWGVPIGTAVTGYFLSFFR